MQKRRYEKASGARPGWGPVFGPMVGSSKKKVARKVATRGTAASPGGSSGGGQTLRQRAGQSARAQASKRARMANAPAPKRKVSGPALGKATAKRTTKAGGITAGTAFGGGKIPASMLKKAKQMAKLKGKK